MGQAEFDRYADEYRANHSANISITGESPEYFAEYKVKDILNAYNEFCAGSQDISILDFGAGIGGSVPFLRRYAPHSRLTCVDVSTKSLQIAEARFGAQARFVAFDGQQLPFEDETFDIVFAACVFHHIEPQHHHAALSEMHRVLARGGLAIVYEHNPYNPLTRHAVNTCPFDENAVLLPAQTTKKGLAAAGFSHLVVRYRVFFPAALRWFRFMEHWLTWMPLGAQYYVAARK